MDFALTDEQRMNQESMQRFAKMSILEVWYYYVEVSAVQALFDKYAKKSAKQTSKTRHARQPQRTGGTGVTSC